MKRLGLLATLAIAIAACGGAPPPSAASATIGSDAGLAELRVDYATYSPPSLVLKQQGWVEQAFPGVTVKWVYSAGSSNALNFLQGNSVDFGSTAGSAALLSRANGNPIKVVYIYEQPEWTALVVAKDSTAKSITDLRGKKIAAQKGTDPYFFLLRTLQQAGLSQADIQYVNLPHADGRTALERGQVDAWSGLDPHMAASELQAGSKLIYRNKDFNTYGFLNAREDFLRKYPETTKRLIQLYERAKQWVIDNPDAAAQTLSDAANLSLDVAKRELNERMNFKTSGIPGEAHIAVLRAVIPTIQAEQLANPGADVAKAVTDLVDGTWAKAVIR
ncbi:MAG TPA: aliphatic sulfonate ABC transporter substrate-binding protein [Candidatus Limnocylindria bacterium]|nr:aliphatic sulfonate ABC transporter substrate-binding protein [Candidatus Limnocylindria bacterium]